MKSYSPYLIEIFISCSLYVGFFFLIGFATENFKVNSNVSWLFLPAGLRIFLTLIFSYTGAIGLTIAALIINYFADFPHDLITTFGIALICGFSPLISRLLVINHIRVDPDLNNITAQQLILIILIFAFFSSGLHQLWFITLSLEIGGWNSFIAMFIGDILGSIVFLVIFKYGFLPIIKKFGKFNSEI